MLYQVVIVAIIIGEYLLDLLVDALNVLHSSHNLPREFEGWYDADRYGKSQEYLSENSRFGLVVDTLSTPLTILFILVGGFNYVDLWVRSAELGTIWTGLMFTGALVLASTILGLPASLYGTFVIEEKYGFNRTTAATFILDRVKSLLLMVIIGGPLLAGLLWFFEKAGSMAWVYSWVFVTVVQVVLMFVAPVLIMPLFNKFLPLEEGELRDSIEEYARSQQLKMKGVFTMDGSKRSTKSNAFFTGFGRFRRIVLFDTLIEKHTVDELVSVLAHETGHYRKRHIALSLAVSILTTGVMLFLLSFFLESDGLFAAFKMEHKSIYAGFVFFGFLFAPINMVLSILGNLMSRKHEYEADAFAVSTHGKPESMIAALKRLSVDNLSNLTPHPLNVFLNYSHPPVLQRINAIRRR